MTDLLLINPPAPKKGVFIIRDFNRSGRTSKEKIIWPQTSLAYLAAMTPKNVSVKIVDCIAEKITWENLQDILKKEKPKYIGAHVITSTAHNDLRTFRLAKKINSNTKTITFGPHGTELTKETFKECPNLDFIIRREPEITFKELINTLESNKKRFSKIKGLAFKKSNKIFINPKRPFIKNLDKLPLPRHDLLPIEKYTFPFMASGFTFVVASRGCPYSCSFCRQPIMWNCIVRQRSPENIIKELKFLKKFGVKEFLLSTDTFTLKKAVVKKVCKLMIKEKLNLKWACNSRVDTIDQEMAQWMKKAGCWMIALGLESGSNKILQLCNKKTTLTQGKKAVKIITNAGIKVYGYFIIGLPGETKKTIRRTIDFAKSLPITFAIFHIASPYPGTKFYEIAKERGWLTSEKWEDADQGNSSPVDYPQLSGKEIIQGIKRAYKEFYLRPKAIWRILYSVKNIKDLNRLVGAGINQIFWK